jgi:hypothetical protein
MGSDCSRVNNAVFELVPWETLKDLDFDADVDFDLGGGNSKKNRNVIQTIKTNQGFAMFYPERVHELRKKRRSDDSKSSKANRFRFRLPTAESTKKSTEPEVANEDRSSFSSYDSPTMD